VIGRADLTVAVPVGIETAEHEEQQRLREELGGLRVMALHKRASSAGVSDVAIEEAMDSSDPKGTLIELLLAQPVLSSTKDDKPHFGAPKQQEQEQRSSKPAPRKGLLPANKHAMISYQWGDQDRVIAARESLTKLGVPCWMDIDGGMQQDIYESMAAGVENAACVVCFLSQKYQDSENCKLELKFAKQSGVPIVPVMAEKTRGWRPSGWLGIVVAGALWTPLGDESEMEGSIRSLVDQIRGAVPGSGGGGEEGLSDDEYDDNDGDGGDGEAANKTGAELRAELDRLRQQIEARDSKAVATGGGLSYDPDAPAEVPL
jgi:hypothetical protein